MYISTFDIYVTPVKPGYPRRIYVATVHESANGLLGMIAEYYNYNVQIVDQETNQIAWHSGHPDRTPQSVTVAALSGVTDARKLMKEGKIK